MHQSVATIKSPEFINLQPLEINPLMSSCDIKVLYVGQNRNRSYITKAVASDMAKTLRGAPIVGYYRADAEDFGDHGDQMIIDGNGIQFNCLTRPYGFVSPDARVWFQEFEDTDDFGNKTTREYLMTTGYLWTGQFEEARRVIEKGNNQSMELDSDSLDGYWSTDSTSGIDFFIINDATFSKICLLGEDVEPCFEGASVTAPVVSRTFSKNEDDFKVTLYSMMKELKDALERRSDTMNKEDIVLKDDMQPTAVLGQLSTEITTSENNTVTTFAATEPAADPEFKKADDEEKKEEKPEDKSDDTPAEQGGDDKKEDESDDEKKKGFSKDESDELASIDYQAEFAKISTAFNELKAQFDTVTEMNRQYIEQINKLKEFKKQIDDKEKDALIEKFYMLADEDKADVIANKDKYTLDEIEAKLSVICFRKKVNFDLGTNGENENKVEDTNADITAYRLSDDECAVPAWIKAVLATQNKQ